MKQQNRRQRNENLKNYPVEILLEAEPNKKYLRRDFADYYLRNDDIVEALSEDTVRFHCIKRQPPILHNKMLLMCRARDAAQILLTKSQNIKIKIKAIKYLNHFSAKCLIKLRIASLF